MFLYKVTATTNAYKSEQFKEKMTKMRVSFPQNNPKQGSAAEL
jgi:hypothetical protein